MRPVRGADCLGLDLEGLAYYFRMTVLRAVNSAVECHLHTVEAAGSTPAPPTTTDMCLFF